jgi:hypothetical protein
MKNGRGAEQGSSNSFEDFIRAIAQIKPTLTEEEKREDQKIKRERKKTVRPGYGFDVTFCIIRNPVPTKCKFMEFEYETHAECRVVIRDDELEYWRKFWYVRGLEVIECLEDWTRP